jgi:hypothetical protein
MEDFMHWTRKLDPSPDIETAAGLMRDNNADGLVCSTARAKQKVSARMRAVRPKGGQFGLSAINDIFLLNRLPFHD